MKKRDGHEKYTTNRIGSLEFTLFSVFVKVTHLTVCLLSLEKCSFIALEKLRCVCHLLA